MHRIAIKMKIYPGQAAEYKRRHDELWEDVAELLKNSSVSDYSIFLDEETNFLFASLKVENMDKFNQIPNHPVIRRWWKYMADIMETNEDNSPVSITLREVFYLP